MLIDHIRQAHCYAQLSPAIATALNYLAKTNFAEIAPGRYEIDGDRIYAMVQDYETLPRAEGLWEAHRRYIDVQFIASGTECIGYAPIERLTVSEPYEAEKDLTLFHGAGDFLTLVPQTFAIFYPQDAHMPGRTLQAPTDVRKVVVKVAV